MKMLLILFSLIISISENGWVGKEISKKQKKRYQPTWKSLDTRVSPTWYDESKFGIFLHWGLYSVPGLESEWFWNMWKNNVPEYANFMKENYSPKFQYQEFSKDFDALFFDPDHFANVFYDSGAKYVVLTSKHHDGFALWNSSFSWNWNSVNLRPHRNLLVELANAVRRRGLKFCVYFSLLEWYHPLYMQDQKNHWRTSQYADTHAIPQLKELINLVKPDCIWSDGDWPCTSEYWKAKEFLAWLFNDSPVKDTVLVNDRWGEGTYCKHGDFKNCRDDYQPDKPPKFKWEDAFTLDTRNNWGHRHNISHNEVKSMKYITSLITKTISMGGNALLNIGISQKGTIEAIFQDRLHEVGKWMRRNSLAIYNTKVCKRIFENATITIYYTCRDSTIFAFQDALQRDHMEFCSTLHYVRPTDGKHSTAKIQILGHKYIPSLKVEKKRIKICVDFDTMLDIHGWDKVVFQLDGFQFVK